MTGVRLLLLMLTLAASARAATIETVAGTGTKTLNKNAGAAADVNIGQPFGVEVGPGGALYITEVENHRVMKWDPASNQVTTVAGNGTKGHSGDGGKATDAAMNEPYEVRFDTDGNMYVVERVGACVRKVDAKTGLISTIAGNGTPGFGGDGGPATAAQLNQPHSIALDGKGGLYIADIINHRIRKVDLAKGTIETIAGTGAAKNSVSGKPAKDQPIRGPRALCVTGSTLWIVLREGNAVWSLDLSDGIIKHIAGGVGKAGMADGSGEAATFNGPKGVAVGPDHMLYIMDTENHAVRKVDPKSGAVSTVAGGGPAAKGYGGDGGDALTCKMNRPHGIAVDGNGNIYIGDSDNHRVRRVKP